MPLDRRRFLALTLAAPVALRTAAASVMPSRPVPRTGQPIPMLGMGSWITFDVGDDGARRARCVEVVRRLFEAGGRVLDSSPMYGTAPDVLGHCLAELDATDRVLAASKVWIPGRERGIEQMTYSRSRWGLPGFWLMQVHNLVDWRTHLPTLLAMRDKGELTAVGITTSHGRRHGELLRIMGSQPLDTVQFTYNIGDREAERRLLPAAADAGLGVLVNRPFATGGLFRAVAGRPLPPWASELAIDSWARFFLRYVLSHPAVTCAIPATSDPNHMTENLGAVAGPMPDEGFRKRMARWFDEVSR